MSARPTPLALYVWACRSERPSSTVTQVCSVNTRSTPSPFLQKKKQAQTFSKVVTTSSIQCGTNFPQNQHIFRSVSLCCYDILYLGRRQKTASKVWISPAADSSWKMLCKNHSRKLELCLSIIFRVDNSRPVDVYSVLVMFQSTNS